MARLWEDHDLAARARTSGRRRLLGTTAECADCKESDLVVLRREDDGEALCLNCRALRKAPIKPNIWPLSLRRCTACGFAAPFDREDGGLFEWHHTAGRANLPEHTTLLCLNCHAKVSDAQRAIGVDLSTQADQRGRVVESFNSAFCELSVAATCASERMPATWWQGFQELLPALVDGVAAMVQVIYLAPDGDSS